MNREHQWLQVEPTTEIIISVEPIIFHINTRLDTQGGFDSNLESGDIKVCVNIL